MRLLLQDDFFGMIGALVLAAFTVWLAWLVLEVVLGLPSVVAIALAFGATAGLLELLSRRESSSTPPVQAVATGLRRR